ncbi:TetR/AcrR family transcriptional regulator [Actinomadura fulvescens]|uniref:TetR/AcrR family transcriptional regulator n=1 Tax=Actinomadura fulvescens TaxID=46160 RepID=A0ABN3QLD6_9ACTN
MAESRSADKRRYRGMDGPEREAARREQLIEAGLELFGTAGYAATTVENVSRRAQLAKKYFYESFADREALLITIYRAEITKAQEAVVLALSQAGPTIEERAAAGLSALIRTLGADPRVTRLVFREIIRVATPTTEALYEQAKHDFGEFIIGVVTETLNVPRTKRLQMGATVLVGAVNELMTDWILGEMDATVDEIVEISSTLFNVVYQQYVRELSEGKHI